MEEKFVIHGGKPLKGTVEIGGAKNAAVAILPAAILAQGECTIENLPRIADVLILARILKDIGAKVTFSRDGVMKLDTSDITSGDVSTYLTTKLRASYYFLGAMLGTFGEANISLPGGCAIGERPIDQHIKGIEKLNATVKTEYGKLTAHTDELVGADVYLDVVSVGATINIMLAAAKATGTTTIINAAKEPHVVDVANFLNMMGARIKGAGTDIIKIKGVQKMHGCTYSVIPDQIETGTIMIAAAATHGDVTVKNVIPTHMEALISKLTDMGVEVEEGDDYINVSCNKRPKCANIKTMPYPGFPTDLQQPATVLLSTASGTSVIVENIFESRFKHINEIRRMGAKVTIDDRIAVLEGVEKLTGAPVRATDLRAGAALIVAGLMADGVTEIHNIKYIDRGYDHIERKLVALGADIKREKYYPEEEIDFEDLI